MKPGDYVVVEPLVDYDKAGSIGLVLWVGELSGRHPVETTWASHIYKDEVLVKLQDEGDGPFEWVFHISKLKPATDVEILAAKLGGNL